MKKMLNISSFSLLLISSLSSSCNNNNNNNNGLFGHSNSKEEAKVHGSPVTEYVPNKKDFLLFDGTKMQIDTAWTEINFSYRNGKRILDSSYGFQLGIPYKIKDDQNFTFNFHLADTSNRVFVNGRELRVCYLYARKLYNEIAVILEQKNPDTLKGWMKPIVTDTIIFTRIK